MTIVLRPYQADAVECLRQAYMQGARAPLLVLPTAAGKTTCFGTVAAAVAARGRSVWIVVHRQELMLQASRKLDEFGVGHGIIAPGHSPTHDPVQVVSVQTVARRIRDGRLRGAMPNLLVLDEAHHAVASTWRDVLAAFPDAKLLGVTATPVRLDGKGLGHIFDRMIVGPSVRDLTDDGYLASVVVYTPPGGVDTSGLHRRYGEYVHAEAETAADKPAITGCAIDHYRRLGRGLPAIAFCVSVKHAEHVAEQFRAAGYRAASLDGSATDAHRRNLICALGTGGLDVLTSCDLIGEGLDVPGAGVAILLRPTASFGLHRQQIGRVMRPVYAPGYDNSTREGRLAAIAASEKPFAIVLDHAGNTGQVSGGAFVPKHGLPDEDVEWSLEQGVGRTRGGEAASAATVRQCPRCYAAHRPAPRCPACGHVYKDEGRAIRQVDGELVRVDMSAVHTLERHAKREEVHRARTREQLERIAQERGYHPAWVEHVMRAREAKQAARRARA